MASSLIIFGTLIDCQPNTQTQTNDFRPSRNVGLGTANAAMPYLKPLGSSPAWIGLENNAGIETGIPVFKAVTDYPIPGNNLSPAFMFLGAR